MGGRMTYSPAKKKARANRRRRQDREWAAQSGPVVVRYVDPKSLQGNGPEPPP
jgi:hypothetical protein